MDTSIVILAGGICIFLCILALIAILFMYKAKAKAKATSTSIAKARAAATSTSIATNIGSLGRVDGLSSDPVPLNRIPLTPEEAGISIAISAAIEATTSGFGLRALKKAAEYLNRKLGIKIGKRLSRAVWIKLSNKLVKLGARFGIKAGERIGAKAASRLAATATVAATSGPAAPFVEIAELAASAFTGYLDTMNLGGFQGFHAKEYFDSIRDAMNKQYTDALSEAGIQAPVIIGPLDIISEEQSNLLMLNEIIRLGNDDDATVAQAFVNVCGAAGGVMVTHPVTGEQFCSWTDPSKCIAKWPPGLNPDDSIYYEYDKTYKFCVQKPAVMKATCEKVGYGVTYNSDTGSCTLTDNYCRRYGADDGIRNGDCAFSKGEQIATMIFGTAFVSGIVNVFGSENYAPCDPGDVNLMPVDSKLGNFFCQGNHCSPGQESIGGICYQECRRASDTINSGPGAKQGQAGKNYVSYSDANRLKVSTCYEECPSGFNATALYCTRNEETRTDIGRIADCPNGWNDDMPGFCARGGSVNSWSFWGAFQAAASVTVKPKTEVGVCRSNEYRVGELCYPNCDGNNGYRRTADGSCQKAAKSIDRDSYVRQPKDVSTTVYMKRRITPYATTTKEDFEASAFGHQVNHFAQGVNSGDPRKMGEGALGMIATGNLVTNALGVGPEMGDLMVALEDQN